MIRLDIHVHSKYSYDSISEPEDIVKIAKIKGLQGLAITDHNTIKGGLETKKFEDNNFIVIIGSEIATTDGEIIGLFLNREIPGNLSMRKTLEEIHEQGGLAIIPHPFDTVRKHAVKFIEKKTLELINGIETLNARSKSVINENAQDFANKSRTKKFAGSDAHTLIEIGRAGIIVNTLSTAENHIKQAIINNQFTLYQKYVPKIIYKPFDLVGKQLKKKKIKSELSFRILNTMQYFFI